jgi:hypothetical protein
LNGAWVAGQRSKHQALPGWALQNPKDYVFGVLNHEPAIPGGMGGRASVRINEPALGESRNTRPDRFQSPHAVTVEIVEESQSARLPRDEVANDKLVIRKPHASAPGRDSEDAVGRSGSWPRKETARGEAANGGLADLAALSR